MGKERVGTNDLFLAFNVSQLAIIIALSSKAHLMRERQQLYEANV